MIEHDGGSAHGAETIGGLDLRWPCWIPREAAHYICHVERGISLRYLARQSGCHPSTILRQVRRLESRRDDPLVDLALRRLGHATSGQTPVSTKGNEMSAEPHRNDTPTDDETLASEARRVLRRLCETGALLAVVPDMEKAVIVRETPSGTTQRTAVVDTAIAQAMALKEWIACKAPGRIARYHITSAGRAELSRLLAHEENRVHAERNATGMAEAQTPFAIPGGLQDAATEKGESSTRQRRIRYSASETPLAGLARRRDKDGKSFLCDDLVSAGERLREDFELAQMGPRMTQNWNDFLTGGNRGGSGQGDANRASASASDRVARALRELGPGLGDVALRCCCYLEGLETAEKQMGWSARSGKIVLRIALQRLRRYYDEDSGDGAMIG